MVTASVLPGPCQEKHANWHYASETGECTAFSYSGCEGNANRFETREQCDRQCGEFRDQDVCSMEKVGQRRRGMLLNIVSDVSED